MHCVHIIWGFKHAIITCYATPEIHVGSGFQEQDMLCTLEKKYHTLTGGRNFPKPGGSSSMKEVSRYMRSITSQPPVVSELEENYCKSGTFFYSGQLFKQELLHISEPDLIYVDGSPHSPCPSSASFSSSSSHIPSPELYPVRLQEVNLERA